MIVFFRPKALRLDAQLPGHAEMDPDPIAAGKFEEHLFSPRLGAQEARAHQVPGQRARVLAPKDALPRVQLHTHNLRAEAGVPLPAIIFNFSELGHEEKML
jgi:hypothetical protein